MSDTGDTKLTRPPKLPIPVRRRPTLPMPYTGPWERKNPELAGRIWRCLSKQFQDYEDLIKRAAVYSESPIEEAFLAALLTEDSAFYYEGQPILLAPGQPYNLPEPGDDSPSALFIIAPQFPIGDYRIDVAAAYTYTGKRVAIELDGHEFHEKTAKQATHDKGRDRALLAAGWPTMRFTGSEIHADPNTCAAQVARFLADDTAYSPEMLIVGRRG